MNISLSFLSLSSNSRSPFLSSGNVRKLELNKITNFRFFAPFFQSFFSPKFAKITKSKFTNSLAPAVSVSNLQTFSKTNMNKEEENEFFIEESQFIECKSSQSKIGGGAIRIESVTNVSILKCSFILCSATVNNEECGGAIFVSGKSTSINLHDNCFSRCSASKHGNAVFIDCQGTAVASNMTAINNCPVFLKKQQHASIYVSGEISFTNFNISQCHTLSSPAFSFSSLEASACSFFTITNQTGSRKFVIFDFESNTGKAQSYFKQWNIVFDEPKNQMTFKVLQHTLIRVVFYGGESDYSFEVTEGSLFFDSIRSDKKLKVGKPDEKTLSIIDEYTFDKDAIKLNENPKVRDNQCKLVFNYAEEKEPISVIYILAPFLIIALSVGVILTINTIIKFFTEAKLREDEKALRKPNAITLSK